MSAPDARYDRGSEPVLATILLIDDDPGVIQTSSRLLRLEGYRVHTAMTAEMGLRAVDLAHPDVILLDLRMPLIDGLGFLRRLRATAHPKTPVAIVTADYFPDKRVIAEIHQLGADLQFKPVWLEGLVGITCGLMSGTFWKRPH